MTWNYNLNLHLTTFNNILYFSAGVGRTGTIILADACLRMAAAEGYVDVLGFQQQIREQRANMVDNLVCIILTVVFQWEIPVWLRM
jgi:protein tyrosine phosphatase